MRIFPLLFLSLLYGISATAQPPGYVGKRAISSIETYSFPNLFLVIDEQYPLRINFRIGASAEYVMSRRFSWGTSASAYQTQTDYNFGGSWGFMGIEGYSVGFNAKFYTFHRRGNIAPIGPYQRIEVLYTSYGMTDLDRVFYADGRTDLGRSSDMIVGIEVGSQRVFGNRLTYHYALHAGWLLKVLDNRTTPRLQHLKDVATTRLRGLWGFSANVGIGVLLF